MKSNLDLGIGIDKGIERRGEGEKWEKGEREGN